MLYMLISRTRPDLSPEDYAELGRMAQQFYESPTSGFTLLGDWAANDGSRTFALVEADTPERVDEVQAPFRKFVDIEIVPVSRVKGWGKR